jgi:hypothetical protein
MPLVQKSTLYYPDRAPVQVQVDVELQATPDQILQKLMDCPSWTQWFPDVQSCFESTPLPRVAENNPSYPLGSTRQISIGGIIFDEEIIAYDDDGDEKVWAFSVYETSQALVRCMVERVVLEPVYDDKNTVVGTSAHYAAGLELIWYLRPFLKPVLQRSMKKSWKQAFRQLDRYIEQQTK